MFDPRTGHALIDRHEQAILLALTDAASSAKIAWHEVANLVEVSGSASAILGGPQTAQDKREELLVQRLIDHFSDSAVELWNDKLDALLDKRTWLVTVLDDEYPGNLRRIYNRPPFLFVRGTLRPDRRSVAVVGTRQASPAGQQQAAQLAGELARRGIQVVSGLAAGIDTAAHTATLDTGGRTIAVMGTGIDRVYPAENAGLAERIPHHGALVSQFWPGTPPRAENFPLRNVVSSGLAMGTVVVEASGKSGARQQARIALEHGKRLFLVEPLVLQEEWAKKYALRPGTTVVKSVDDLVAVLEAEELAERTQQLSLL